jgi:hypothetical protein
MKLEKSKWYESDTSSLNQNKLFNENSAKELITYVGPEEVITKRLPLLPKRSDINPGLWDHAINPPFETGFSQIQKL